MRRRAANEQERRRLMVIGLDGADLRLLAKWTQTGDLPFLAKVIRNAAWGGLRSTDPPMTGPAWCSFMSGLPPSKHGVLDFHHRIPYSYERQHPMISSVDAPKAFWEVVSDLGSRVIVMGVPVTYPPRPVNGIVISGLLTPEQANDYCYPESVKQELIKLFGVYRTSAKWEKYHDQCAEEVLEDVMIVLEQQLKVFRHLVQNHPWDLSICVLSAPDQVQHFYWKYLSTSTPPSTRPGLDLAILNVYRAIDLFLGELAESFPETDVLIVSDHGAGPVNHYFHVNEWLAQQGYLVRVPEYTPARSGAPSSTVRSINLLDSYNLAQVRTTVPNGYGVGPGCISIGLWPRRALLAHADTTIEYALPPCDSVVFEFAPAIDGAYWDSRRGDGVRFEVNLVTGPKIETLYSRFLNPKTLPKDRPWQDEQILVRLDSTQQSKLVLKTSLGPQKSFEWTPSGWVEPRLTIGGASIQVGRPAGIDMQRTVAYAGGETELGLFLNVAPLPYATLDERQAAKLGKELAAALRGVVTPEGSRIFAKILPRDQVHSGPHAYKAPHLLLYPHRLEVIPDDGFCQVVLEKAVWRSGTHRRHGIILAYGPGIKRIRVIGASILDIAPTVLAYLKGVMQTCDGKVLQELFTRDITSDAATISFAQQQSARVLFDPDDERQREERLKGLGYL